MYAKEIRTRLTWLTIGLVASLLIARLIHSFEEVLSHNIILASFIPLIVYMSDAVGTQMEAIIIRELNQKKKFHFGIFFRKQIVIIIPVGAIIAAVAAIALYFWQHNAELSYVIGISLFAGIISSILTGAIMPYLFWRLHEDPAEASGPVATVIQDFLSVLVFFSVAQLIL